MPIFQLHLPILDEIKEKGLKVAARERYDDAVTRLTSGLSPSDIRSILRDDPPGRPNPRLKPHSEGFWLHMKPTYYHQLVDGVYPTFRLGWFSTFFFVFEIITGVLLMVYYTPSPAAAYENMLTILGNVPFGRLLRDMHRLGAELMVAVVMLHALRTFLTGSYKKPRQFTWATGMILLIVTWLLSFSGYLLPWDQLSLWAVTIGVSMVEAIPPEIVGQTVNLLARGAPEFGANGLLRWYLLHVVAMPLVGIIFFGVHYYKVIHHGHSLPPEQEELGEDTAKRVPTDARVYFFPTIVTRELFYTFALTAMMVVGALFIHAPLEPHADPLITPLHSPAPWYFLWVQGMLKLGDKVIWGLIVPGILISGLLVLPYIEVGPSRRYGDRRLGLTAGAVVTLLFAITSYMGTPWYAVQTSPEQEAVAELVPETHPGPLRLADWDELVIGTYDVKDYTSAPTPTLRAVLEEFHQGLSGIPKDERLDHEGIMVIEDWQTGLKKVTLRVLWTNAKDGGPGEYSQTVYIHEDSNYGQGE
jgi:ubiquinol-cytochrome c reductase cytochrome b subunit